MADEPLWKRPWEEIWFYHDFKRVPVPGWLADGETISSIDSVKVYSEAGVEQLGMIASTQITGTRVGYKVTGGVAGTMYEVRIRITTSASQKFEDHAALEVVSD